MPFGGQAAKRPFEAGNLLGFVDEKGDAFALQRGCRAFEAARIPDMGPGGGLLVDEDSSPLGVLAAAYLRQVPKGEALPDPALSCDDLDEPVPEPAPCSACVPRPFYQYIFYKCPLCWILTRCPRARS
jgi:hypothetical protein